MCGNKRKWSVMRGQFAKKVIGSFAGSFRFALLRGGWESGHSTLLNESEWEVGLLRYIPFSLLS